MTSFLDRVPLNTFYRYQSKFFAMPELADRPGGVVEQVLPYQREDWLNLIKGTDHDGAAYKLKQPDK